MLVCFIDEPANDAAPAGHAAAGHGRGDATRIAELERELEAAQAELQVSIQNEETSNQEQKAINEEALSVNEEFQSTNEELLTSKEELQSLNEELTALNSQLLDSTPRGQEFLTRTPMGRFGNTDELIGAAVYLASDAASFVAGQIIAVDGGFLASGVNQ